MSVEAKKSGCWNHRVIRHSDKVGASPHQHVWYAIHEVHYDEAGNVVGCTQGCSYPMGEDITVLAEEVKMFVEALKQPALDYGTINKPE